MKKGTIIVILFTVSLIPFLILDTYSEAGNTSVTFDSNNGNTTQVIISDPDGIKFILGPDVPSVQSCPTSVNTFGISPVPSQLTIGDCQNPKDGTAWWITDTDVTCISGSCPHTIPSGGTITTDKQQYFMKNEVEEIVVTGTIPSSLIICDLTPIPDGGGAYCPGHAGPSVSLFDPNGVLRSTGSFIDNSTGFIITGLDFETFKNTISNTFGTYTLKLNALNGNLKGDVLATTTFEVVPHIQLWTSFGSFGSDDGKFGSPGDIILDNLGNIYVTDGGNNRIQKFNSEFVFQSKFGSMGSDDGQFLGPDSIVLDSSGNIYVSDFNNKRVQKFNSEGVFQGWMGACTAGSNCDIVNQRSSGFSCSSATCTGSEGTDDGQFRRPAGIDFDSSGNLYVVDRFVHNIQKFDSSGNFISKFGTLCEVNNGGGCIDPDGGGPLELGDGQFRNPVGVSIDSSDNIYVVDRGNNRIQKFDSNNNFLFKLGSVGSGDGGFSNPLDVAFDISDNFYVVDDGNDQIQKFDSNGNFLSKFGFKGSGDGQFNGPHGIILDKLNNLYVTDGGNHRVHKFGDTFCSVPPSGDMIVTRNCDLISNSSIVGSLIVQNGTLMTIPNSISLDMSQTQNITIENGSGILIKFGAMIFLHVEGFGIPVLIPAGTSVPGCEQINKCYEPFEVTINVGEQVTWKNNDSAAHTVTSGSVADGPSGVFDSGLFSFFTTFSHTFDAAGEFPYYCMVHPWMSGKVIVE